MWRCGCDVLRRHPRFSGGTVEGLPIEGDVSGEDEPIEVVSRDGHLALGQGHVARVVNHVDLLAVGDALQGLNSPDGQSFVGVDARRDRGEGEGGHRSEPGREGCSH